MTSISHAWRALRHRNFRLFVSGQTVSLIGNWMTRLATSWLVYRLTHSALLLGFTGFAGQILTFALAPFAGVWIERMDRRKLLVWTQIVAAIQSFALAGLTLAHRVRFWEVIALTALQGVVNAFDMPARQSFLVQMVDDRKDLGNAVAINSSMTNGTRLIGPAIAGLVIAGLGEGWCFLLDGVSYIAVIASLMLMRVQPISLKRHAATMWEQMREGWAYVSTFRPIRTILLLFALVGLVGTPYGVLLPIFAAQVLHGNAHTLGWLTGASGTGALVSALSLTLRKSIVGLTRMIQLSAVVFGLALVCFSFSTALWLSMFLMLFIGFGMMQVFSASNTIIQTLVSEDKRARVMSYYAMAFFGTAPFGSLIAGFMGHKIGAPHTVFISGILCLFASVWFTTELPKVHAVVYPLYEQMGLMSGKES